MILLLAGVHQSELPQLPAKTKQKVFGYAHKYGVPFVSKLHFSRDLVNNALYIK